jgi:hypothetical protein
MATFGEVQQIVRDIVQDDPPEVLALIPAMLNKAVAEAETRHNFFHMEDDETLVTTPNTRLLGALPERYKESRGKPRIEREGGEYSAIQWGTSESELYRRYGDDSLSIGSPEFILEAQAGFLVFPLSDGLSDWPDDEYRVIVPLYRYSPALVSAGATNFILSEQNYWYAAFYAAAECFALLPDEKRLGLFAAKAEREFQKLLRADSRRRIAKVSTLSFRRDVHSPVKHPRRRL